MTHRRVAVLAGALLSLLLPLSVMATPAASAAPGTAAPLVAVAHLHLLDSEVKAGVAASAEVLGVDGVPSSGVSAVVLSLSLAKAAATGTLTAFPYGARRPGVVSLSFTRGAGASSQVVVAPATGGRVSVFNRSLKTEHVLVTAIAYYAAPGTAPATHAAVALVPLTERRLASVAVKAHGATAVTALGRGGIPSSGVAGLVVSLTVAGPERAGAVVAYASGATAPKASSLSFRAGRSATAGLIVTVGGNGRIVVADRSGAAARVDVDVVGYLLRLQAPSAPQTVTALGQARSATVSWSPPSSDGGTPIGSYTVVASPGGDAVTVGPASRSAVVTGLTGRQAYTFTVMAGNERGAGPVSAPSAAVVPYTVPGAPAAPSATSTAAGQAVVAWSGPADDGGSTVTGYQVTAEPGGATVTSTTTTATLTTLPGGGYYTFTVVALNNAGSSPASLASEAALVEGISRVSSSPTGDPGDDDSKAPSVSQHGRYVAFQSAATNLVGQPGSGTQVYVRDRQTGVTTLASVAMSGAPGDGDSTAPSISADGRYVAFSSTADDLVGNDNNHTSDVFVRDLTLGATRLLSAINGVPGNQLSYQAVISADGSAVAFTSYASNLTAIGTGGQQNVYVVPLSTGVVSLVSLTSTGGAATNGSNDPAISGDGLAVAFESSDNHLQTAVATTTSTNQIYLRDLHGVGVTSLVSYAGTTPGDQISVDPTISGDGTYVAFGTLADNLVAQSNSSSLVLVADTITHVLTAVGAGPAQHPSISADGSFVAYDNSSPLTRTINLGPGHHQEIFRSLWAQGVTLLVSSGPGGVEGNGDSQLATLSNDGQHVAFQSLASNLTPGVTNPSVQVLVADLG